MLKWPQHHIRTCQIILFIVLEPWTCMMYWCVLVFCSFNYTVRHIWLFIKEIISGEIFQYSIIHVYSSLLQFNVDTVKSVPHNIILQTTLYNGGHLKETYISIYFIDWIIVFFVRLRLNWLFNLFGWSLCGRKGREIDISLNIFCTVVCLQHQMWNRKYMPILIWGTFALFWKNNVPKYYKCIINSMLV